MSKKQRPALLILNQMAGPMTWELAEDLGEAMNGVALFTGHPDTLQKEHPYVELHPAAPYQRGNFARRALSWLHYCLQALFWLWRQPAEVPLLLFSNPPILCWLGYLLKHLRGTSYAVMVHDIYPDVPVRMGHLSESHPVVRLWRSFNRRAYESASVVMTLGEYMARTLAAQFDATRTPAGQVEVIYPWVDTEKIKPIPKEENWFAQKYDQVDKLTVMYSGNMGLGHDIETMLEAARQLRDEPRIHFMFIGAGPKWSLVQETLEKEQLPNVILLHWQPEEQLPYQLATADVGLVSLESEFQGLAVPSKGIYALAVGSVLLVLASEGNELSGWATTHDCGTVVPPGDAEKLALALRYYLEHSEVLNQFCRNARTVAVRHFQRRRNTSLLCKLWPGNGNAVMIPGGEELNRSRMI